MPAADVSLPRFKGDNFSVAMVGAYGDTKQVLDGAMTSGSATLSSSTAAFTAEDVGKTCCVNGAGSSGLRLETTISAYVSATQVTLASNAGTSVSGATITWGHPDQDAFQDGVDLAANGTLNVPRPKRGCMYWLRSKVTVASPVHVKGKGQPKILFDFPLSTSTANGMCFKVTSGDVHFSGLWFTQVNLQQLICYTTRRAFLFVGSSGTHIKRVGVSKCKFTDFCQYALTFSTSDPTPTTVLPFMTAWSMATEFQYCDHVLCENNTLDNATGYFAFTDTCNDLKFIGNRLNNNMIPAITVNAACYRVLVDGNWITGDGYIGSVAGYWGGKLDFISQHSGGQPPNAHVTVTNNFFSGRTMYGAILRFGSISHALIANNTFYEIEGLSTSSTSPSFTFIGPYPAAGTTVYFVEDTWAGISMDPRGDSSTDMSDRSIHNVTIANNQFSLKSGLKKGVAIKIGNYDPSPGLDMPIGRDMLITGNRVKGGDSSSTYWGNGIVLTGNNSGYYNVTIKDNHITAGPSLLLGGAICVVSSGSERLVLDVLIEGNVIDWQEGLGTATSDAYGIQLHQYIDRVVCRENRLKGWYWAILVDGNCGNYIWDLDHNVFAETVNTDIALGGSHRMYERALRYSDTQDGIVTVRPGDESGVDTSTLRLGVRVAGSGGSARVFDLAANRTLSYFSILSTDGSTFAPEHPIVEVKYDGSDNRFIPAVTADGDWTELSLWCRPTGYNSSSRNFSLLKSYNAPQQMDVCISSSPTAAPRDGTVLANFRATGLSLMRSTAGAQAKLHIGGSADGAAESASIKLAPGVLLSSAEEGVIEYSRAGEGDAYGAFYLTVLRADGLALKRAAIQLGEKTYTANRNLQTDSSGFIVAGKLALNDSNYVDMSGITAGRVLKSSGDGTKVTNGTVDLTSTNEVSFSGGTDGRFVVKISGALATPYSLAETQNLLLSNMDSTGRSYLVSVLSTPLYDALKADFATYTYDNKKDALADYIYDAKKAAFLEYVVASAGTLATALASYFVDTTTYGGHTHPYSDTSGGGTVTVGGTPYTASSSTEGKTTDPPS